MAKALDRELRALAAVRAVLPPTAEVEIEGSEGAHGCDMRVGDSIFEVKWMRRGWPADVRDLLAHAMEQAKRVGASKVVMVAPEMSPGARELLEAAGVGWVDETGAARIATDSLVVSRDPAWAGSSDIRRNEHVHSTSDAVRQGRWRRATLAVAEAVLVGVRPTVQAVGKAAGLSNATVNRALTELTYSGFLTADSARGARSGRRLHDFDGLLTAYVGQVDQQSAAQSLRVAVMWRDPVVEATKLTARFEGWAATGVLAAAVMAPYLTGVNSSEIYVPGGSHTELVDAANQAGLKPATGGRLLLRARPGDGTQQLYDEVSGLRCAPWPRVFADLRHVGVRGEEAADHLLSLYRVMRADTETTDR